MIGPTTGRRKDVFARTLTNAPASSSTRNVPIPAEALSQSLRSLSAAKVVKNDSRMTEIYERVAEAKPGTTKFDALSFGIQTMSSGFHNPLNDATLMVAYISDDAELAKFNEAARAGPPRDSGASQEDDSKVGDDATTAPITDGIEEDLKRDDGITSRPVVEEDEKQSDETTAEPDPGFHEDESQVDDTLVRLWSNDGWLQFDGGEGSMLNTGLSLTELSSGSFTVEAIVQYTGTSSRTWTPIFGASHGPTYSHSESFFVGKRRDTDDLDINIGGLVRYIVSSAGLFDGQERHLAVVFDDVADEIRVFVDHLLIGTRTGITGTLTTTSDLVIAGVGHATGERWEGLIGPHRVTNEALKSEQFLGNDGEPVAPAPTGLRRSPVRPRPRWWSTCRGASSRPRPTRMGTS